VSDKTWRGYALAALALIPVWLLLLAVMTPAVREAHATEPLGELAVAGPPMAFMLAAYGLLAVSLLRKQGRPKWLEGLVLSVGGLMLWLTPYLLAAFCQEPDSIWHNAIARDAGYVFGGRQVQFSEYAAAYPISYLYSNTILRLMGNDVLLYSQVVFPIIFVPFLVLVWHGILGRVMRRDLVFPAMLLALPLLHYVKVYPCPQVFGLALMLGIVYLILSHPEKRDAWLIACALFGVVVLTHPISIFLVFIMIASFFYFPALKALKRSADRARTDARKRVWLGIAVSGLASLAMLSATGRGIMGGIYGYLSAGVPFTVYALDTPGGKFAHPWMVYTAFAAYALVLVIPVVLLLGPWLRHRRTGKGLTRLTGEAKFILKTLARPQYNLYLTAMMLLAFGAALTVVRGSLALLERGLSLALVLCSGTVAWLLLARPQNKGWGRKAFPVLVLVLLVAFPVVRLSMDGYNSFTQAESDGLVFTAESVDYPDTIAMTMPGQVSLYLWPGETFYYTDHPVPQENPGHLPGVVVYRESGYRYQAMRLEGDYERNEQTVSRYETGLSYQYAKVYDNPDFEVFVRTWGVNG